MKSTGYREELGKKESNHTASIIPILDALYWFLYPFVNPNGLRVEDDIEILKARIKSARDKFFLGRNETLSECLSKDVYINISGLIFKARKLHDDINCLAPSFEIDVKKLFRPSKGETVIDIGAHIGLYSLLSAKRVGDEGHVYAFEPNPITYDALIHNVTINNLNKRINTLNIALWNQSQTHTLYLFNNFDAHSTLIPETNASSQITIQTDKMTNIIKKFHITQIDWIKIDVEGGEINVLRGFEDYLNMSRNYIIEIQPSNLSTVTNILGEYRLKRINPFYYYFYK